MGAESIEETYRGYIAALNDRRFDQLSRFVHDEVVRNDRSMSCEAYAAERAEEARAIPDLRYEVDLLVADGDHVAARLLFECTPTGEFLGLPVNGRTVRFAEHVFYRFRECRIEHVWSLLDVEAVRAALAADPLSST